MRRLICVLILVVPATAVAQDYRFPSAVEQWDLFYPTAYKDNDGVDWNCGSIRYADHRGGDFGAGGFAGMDEGRDILAAADGIVTSIHDGEFDRCTGECTSGGFGNNVRITHADGKLTIYAHLKQFSIQVTEDQEVSCGDLLGQMGSSGNSTGPHVHFEVRVDGVPRDPFFGDCSSPPTNWVDQWIYGELPLPYCAGPRPECEPRGVITCGAVVDDRNDGAGSTVTQLAYGCSEFAYTGSEMAWRFATDLDEPVTVDVTGMTEDLDLYLLDSPACDGTGCLAQSTSSQAEDEQLVFDATAGTEYVLVVDGFKGAATDFQLQVSCAGALPPSFEPDAGVSDAGVPDAGGSSDGGAGNSVDDVGGGCGCRTSSGSGDASLVGLLVLLFVRRRKLAGGGRNGLLSPRHDPW